MTGFTPTNETLARLYQRTRGKPRTPGRDAIFHALSVRVRDLGQFDCDGHRYTWLKGAGSFEVTKAVGFWRALALSHQTGRVAGTPRPPRVYRDPKLRKQPAV